MPANVVLLLILIGGGSAQATATTCEAIITGPLTLTGASELRARPLAIAASNASESLTAFTLVSSRLVVHEYKEDYVASGRDLESAPGVLVNTMDHHKQTILVNATLRLGGITGLVGYYPGRDAQLHLTGTDEVTIRPTLTSRVGTADNHVEREPEPHRSYYARQFVEPHLRLDGGNTMTLGGAGSLKVLGSTVEIVSRGNTTRIQTGAERPDGAAGQTTFTHVYVEWDTGTATISLNAHNPPAVLTETTHVDFVGEAVFGASSGTISTHASSQTLADQRVRVAGHFTATVRPQENEGRPTGSLSIAGDMTATSLPLSTVYANRMGGITVPSSGMLLAVAGGAALLAAGGAWVLARRVRRPADEALLTDEEMRRICGDDDALIDLQRAKLLAAFAQREKDDRAIEAVLRAVRADPKHGDEVFSSEPLRGLIRRRPELGDLLRDAMPDGYTGVPR